MVRGALPDLSICQCMSWVVVQGCDPGQRGRGVSQGAMLIARDGVMDHRAF